MAEKIRWGIMGLGNIARKFATGLQALPDAELRAVGSRSADKAAAFGEEFGAGNRYGSYEELVADPEVDVIYVATPHVYHHENTLMCLHAGKHVLCEKPFALNAVQAADMAAVARERGLFLMDAMWTRFLPAIRQVRSWLADRRIGDVRLLTADFGFRTRWNPEGRLLNPKLGGGSLLDVGVYTIALAYMVFERPPVRVTGLAHLGETGVDEQAALVLGYGGGEFALLSCAVRTQTPQEARIDGTEGSIRIGSFWHATQATLKVQGRDPETVDLPFHGNGYNYEAAEVGCCLRQGLTESREMPLSETIEIMETMDHIRAQWGLRYPQEA